MIYFYFLKNCQVTPRGGRQAIQFKSPGTADITSQRIPARYIYFTTHAQFARLAKTIPDANSIIRVLDDLAVDMLLNSDGFPKEIAFYQGGETDDIFKRHAGAVKIAVINGMGVGIGDSIVGLRALEIFYGRLARNYSDISIDMFQRIKPELRPLYQGNKLVNQTYDMPHTLAKLLTYDYHMSLEAFTVSREFNSMPMIDYFLAKLGVDPVTVVANEKRNTFANPASFSKSMNKCLEKKLQAYKKMGVRLLLVHPVASDAVRSIPAGHIAGLLDMLIDNTDFILVSAVDIACKHDRFVNLSRYSKSINDFIYIISQMDAVISVDTSTYHIADCFDIPTVVLFNTIDPSYRIAYYPYVRGIWVGEGADSLSMRHKGFASEDAAVLSDIYKGFDYNKLLHELDSAMKDAGAGAVSG